MTAKTSQKLADTLRDAGFEELAKRAEADEFHDFLSDDAMSSITLSNELARIANDPKRTKRENTAAQMIRLRHHDGEFDASIDESDDWAASPEGQEAFNLLIEEKKNE